MPRLRMGSLSTEWVELIHALCRDLECLGLRIEAYEDDAFALKRVTPDDVEAQESFWRAAHAHAHALDLAPHREWIAAFEAGRPEVFADMGVFKSDVVSPEIEIADFNDAAHRDLLAYLGCSQSVRSRMLVGKRVGLLIWDVGQARGRPLIGGALLASPRFSQPLRDRYLGWPIDVQRNRSGYDPRRRAIRQAGLDRMMQLAVAAALPPYNYLRGARLAALAPLTSQGFEAFARASRAKDDPDLAAIVTTTGLSVTGTPFQRQRIAQLCEEGVKGPKEAEGDLYQRVRPLTHEKGPRASFERLVSADALERARRVYVAAHKNAGGKALTDAMVMAYVLRRLRLRKSVFEGNEMGVHIAMLGERTRGHLESGAARPASERVLLDWARCVSVWKRGFLPTPEGEKELAKKKTRIAHARAQGRRLEAASSVASRDILLSQRLTAEEARVREPDRAEEEARVRPKVKIPI